jgi:hypothetical protein
MRSKAPCERLLLALALAVFASGCGKVRQVSACRSLAHEVNSAMDEVEALARAKPVDEPRIARRYAALAKALRPRAVGEKPLAVAVRDYVAVLDATDGALRSHAQSLKTPNARISRRCESRMSNLTSCLSDQAAGSSLGRKWQPIVGAGRASHPAHSFTCPE